MNVNELIGCFNDTLKISESDILKNQTENAIKSNRIYAENYHSQANYYGSDCPVIVEANTTFAAANKYKSLGKTVVLNFSNPVNPGGGVQRGAMAQEECLCRSSNLFLCLSNENVFNDYYGYHRGFNNSFYSDRLIYTKNVTVFKDDNVVPQLLPQNAWFNVDVITCAAPYIGKRKYTNSTALLELFKSRIKNIFEAAKDNHVEVLILGAFGCGAFKNPPELVAEAFCQVITEKNYRREFKQIVFAIKPTGENCNNLNSFIKAINKLYIGDTAKPIVDFENFENRFMRVPKYFALKNSINEYEFYFRQLRSKYFGKQFSILGDSISTLDGYNPMGYRVFYCGNNCFRSGVYNVADTWWDNVIGYFGGELLVNNSWSGSRVSRVPDQNQLFPSACSDERTSHLHINDINPDVIIIYLGVNDWAFGTELYCKKFLKEENYKYGSFDFAYSKMLMKLRKNYPCTEIWCCTINKTFMSENPNFEFPNQLNKHSVEDYNDIIRNSAVRCGCKLVDLYKYNTPYDTIDGTHPNTNGMKTLAELIIGNIINNGAINRIETKDIYVTNKVTDNQKNVFSKIKGLFRKNKN